MAALLRWLAVLPTAALGGLLAGGLFLCGWRTLLWRPGDGPEWLLTALVFAACAIGAVPAGVAMAPRGRAVVALGIGVLLLLGALHLAERPPAGWSAGEGVAFPVVFGAAAAYAAWRVAEEVRARED